jgi:hypothetical protein
MSQISKTAQVKPTTSDETYGRAITAILALAAAVIVAALLLTRPQAAVPTGAAGGGDLTDGFLPGAMAAHAAQQIRNAQALSDGWEAGLFGPRTTNQEPRDGWESSLFR